MNKIFCGILYLALMFGMESCSRNLDMHASSISDISAISPYLIKRIDRGADFDVYEIMVNSSVLGKIYVGQHPDLGPSSPNFVAFSSEFYSGKLIKSSQGVREVLIDHARGRPTGDLIHIIFKSPISDQREEDLETHLVIKLSPKI